jgi:hypothetical protein
MHFATSIVNSPVLVRMLALVPPEYEVELSHAIHSVQHKLWHFR